MKAPVLNTTAMTSWEVESLKPEVEKAHPGHDILNQMPNEFSDGGSSFLVTGQCRIMNFLIGRRTLWVRWIDKTEAAWHTGP